MGCVLQQGSDFQLDKFAKKKKKKAFYKNSLKLIFRILRYQMNVSLRFLLISPFYSFINRSPDDFNQCDQDNVDQVSTMIALT